MDSKPIFRGEMAVSFRERIYSFGFRSVEVAEAFEVEIQRKELAQLVWFSFNFAPRHFLKLEFEARLYKRGDRECNSQKMVSS